MWFLLSSVVFLPFHKFISFSFVLHDLVWRLRFDRAPLRGRHLANIRWVQSPVILNGPRSLWMVATSKETSECKWDKLSNIFVDKLAKLFCELVSFLLIVFVKRYNLLFSCRLRNRSCNLLWRQAVTQFLRNFFRLHFDLRFKFEHSPRFGVATTNYDDILFVCGCTLFWITQTHEEPFITFAVWLQTHSAVKWKLKRFRVK